MAEHKVNGGDMLLFIDPLGGTNYDTVVCLTSVGIKDSVQPVDASSACGPDKSPGAVDMSISFEGQHLQDPTTSIISGTDLRILLRAEQTIGWLLSPVNPLPGDEIQSGTGYLSELSSTYAFDSVGTFSGTIQPYGMPITTVQSSRFSFRANTSVVNSITLDIYGQNLDLTVYWGDGTSDFYPNNSVFNPTHIYPSLGNYIIEFEFSLTPFQLLLQVANINVSSISNIDKIFSLAYNGQGTLAFQFCNLSSSEVNNVLAQCVALNFNNCNIILDQNSPLAPPTGQGIIDMSTLGAYGNGVVVDSLLTIGQSYAGGNIAYLDNTGMHGFVVYDNGTSVVNDTWSTAYGITGASSYQIGDGNINTAAMIANTTSNIALVVTTGNFNGYNDWVIPTYNEMAEILDQHINNGHFANLTSLIYWTSTENNANQAWKKNNDNSATPFDKMMTTFDTVAIRYF